MKTVKTLALALTLSGLYSASVFAEESRTEVESIPAVKPVVHVIALNQDQIERLKSERARQKQQLEKLSDEHRKSIDLILESL